MARAAADVEDRRWRRRQVLEQVPGIAAGEFANHGLHGASIEAIAREAGITQAYAGQGPVTVKSFLAFGMLLNNVAALDIDRGHQPMKSVIFCWVARPVPDRPLLPAAVAGRSGERLVVRSSAASVWLAARGDEAGFVGDDDELGAVAGAEFHHGPVDVGLGGGRADGQALSDVVVGQAGGDEGEDFPLAG